MMTVSNPGRRALLLGAFAFSCLMEQRPVQEGEPPEPETDGEPPIFLMPPPPTPEGMKRINPRVRIKAKETAEVGCDPMETRKCSKPCNHGLWEDTNVLGCHFEGKCTLFHAEDGRAHAGPCICAKHMWGPETRHVGWWKLIQTPSLVDNETEEDRKKKCPWFGERGAMRDFNKAYPRVYRKTLLWMLFEADETRPPLRKPVPTNWTPTPSKALYGDLPKSDLGGPPPEPPNPPEFRQALVRLRFAEVNTRRTNLLAPMEDAPMTPPTEGISSSLTVVPEQSETSTETPIGYGTGTQIGYPTTIRGEETQEDTVQMSFEHYMVQKTEELDKRLKVMERLTQENMISLKEDREVVARTTVSLGKITDLLEKIEQIELPATLARAPS